jgi:diguanylate cyclase (GGDEF)-like protein
MRLAGIQAQLDKRPMKKLVAFLAITVSAAGASAAPPAPLTSLQAIAALSNAQASQHLPVSFEATVTYYRGYGSELFVQDGDAAIYLYYPLPLNLVPGDRIRVTGTTHESFRPFVSSSEVTIVGHGALPKPVLATYEQMIRAETDCRLVTVRALIRSADLVPGANAPLPGIRLHALVDGGSIDVDVNNGDESQLKDLLDAEVEITGAASGHFDNKMEQTGILMHVQNLNDIKILKRADSDPWSLPITPIDRVITGYRIVDRTQRMRIRGTLTYYQTGSAMVVQDGNRSLWVSTGTYEPLRLGDVVEVTGFPDVRDGFLTLTRAEVKDTMIAKPVVPRLFTWRELAVGGNIGQGHGFDLVSIEGQVVAEVREATQDGYVLSADGHLVSAIFSHPGSIWGQPSDPRQQIKQLPIGSRVRVTGICILSNPNPFTKAGATAGEVAFDIYLRSPDDVSVVTQPPWLNVRHLVYIVGLLMIALLLIGARAWYTEHRSRRRTAILAQIERRRSCVLEDINASRPINDILKKITELAAFTLGGAPCWCHLADERQLGSCPDELHNPSWRIVEHPIVARNGLALGRIFAALVGPSLSEAQAREALAVAAELTTLAIETSRLYLDLVHRSEFDLLTDIYNRFALEASLDALIHFASQSDTVFGLIYIDLNEFKLVNDRYGHHAGDIYLQLVVARMKGQLRPGDTLARLGGDEFAVLVPEARSRATVADIAMRLECSFDDPFELPTGPIKGSASIGVALFPEDGATRDGILSAADAAMYAAKRDHHRLLQMLSDHAEAAHTAQTIK